MLYNNIGLLSLYIAILLISLYPNMFNKEFYLSDNQLVTHFTGM